MLPVKISNFVAGYNRVVQPPALDFAPEPLFKVEYYKQLSQRPNPFNKRQSEYTRPMHKFEISKMKIKPSYNELERMGCGTSMNQSRLGSSSMASQQSARRSRALHSRPYEDHLSSRFASPRQQMASAYGEGLATPGSQLKRLQRDPSSMSFSKSPSQEKLSPDESQASL